ncbi:MAG TPA: EamA family transporter [Candidatus Dormibacteraeota bacterium]|nr:EamA family transporter [Candidatus Dormibacteraeota bacterium]
MIRPSRTSPALLGAGLATIYVVWGTTYLGIRVGVETIPPFFLSGIRYILAGLILFGWVALRGGLRKGWPSPRMWLSAVLTGTGLVAFGNGFLSWGEQYMASGAAAIFIATVPLWMTGMARVFQGEPIRPLAAGGLVLGLAGLAVLVGPAVLQGGPVFAMLACLLAALGWAAATVYSRSAPFPDNPFQVAGMQMLSGGVVVLLFSLVTGDAERFSFAHLSVRSEVAFAYLLLVGAVLGFGVFIWLVKVAPLPLLSTYAYVNPVVAVILGHFLLGEAVSLRTILGGSVVILGVVLIVASQSQPARTREAERNAA